MKSTLTEQSVLLPARKVSRSSADSALRSGDLNRLLATLTFTLALMMAILGVMSMVKNTLEAYPVPLLGITCFLLQVLLIAVYRQHHKWDRSLILLAMLTFVALLVLYLLPRYVTGFQFNAVIHRSLFSGIFLLGLSLPVMSVSLFYLLGATPQAEDISRYPLILIPVITGIGIYLFLIYKLVEMGLPNLTWKLITTPYCNYDYPVKIMIAGDWPKWSTDVCRQVGILNHVKGTGLLMLLTSLISLPIGVGAGIYLSEYSRGWFGHAARFMITSLRAISLLILGLAAASLVYYTSNTPLAPVFHGMFFNGWEMQVADGGSYLTASLVLSLLVIPVIARATEEGCRSLPQDLREGSLALGASEEITLWRIVLPWSLPNIITALLIGCAEVAGSVAVILFISGRGDYGVGVFRQVTSLAFLIFDIRKGNRALVEALQPFQYSAGVLLLMITMGLGIASMLTKRWMTKAFRGGHS